MLRSLFLALAFIVMSGLNGTAIASDIFSFSDMQIRATVPGMKTSAAYVKITNNGVLDDRLIAAQAAHDNADQDNDQDMDLNRNGTPAPTE